MSYANNQPRPESIAELRREVSRARADVVRANLLHATRVEVAALEKLVYEAEFAVELALDNQHPEEGSL